MTLLPPKELLLVVLWVTSASRMQYYDHACNLVIDRPLDKPRPARESLEENSGKTMPKDARHCLNSSYLRSEKRR